MSSWKRSLWPREQAPFLIWNRIQESILPVSHYCQQLTTKPTDQLCSSHSWSARKRMTANCCPLLHCSSQRHPYRLLLHYPCVHRFDFCLLWQLSKKTLQTFTGPLTHNTVKNIVQAATKVSSSKSRKTWNKNQLGDGKLYGLCTRVTPRSLWFLTHHLPTTLSCSTYSINSGQVGSSWT